MKKMLVCASEGDMWWALNWFAGQNPLVLMANFDWCLKLENSNEKKLKRDCVWLNTPHKTFAPNLKRHGTKSKAEFMNKANIVRYMKLCDKPSCVYFYDTDKGEWSDFIKIEQAMMDAGGSCLLIATTHDSRSIAGDIFMRFYYHNHEGRPVEKEIITPMKKITFEDAMRIFG